MLTKQILLTNLSLTRPECYGPGLESVHEFAGIRHKSLLLLRNGCICFLVPDVLHNLRVPLSSPDFTPVVYGSRDNVGVNVLSVLSVHHPSRTLCSIFLTLRLRMESFTSTHIRLDTRPIRASISSTVITALLSFLPRWRITGHRDLRLLPLDPSEPSHLYHLHLIRPERTLTQIQYVPLLPVGE